MNMECRARDETFCLGQYHPWRPASADAPLSWAGDDTLAPFAGQPAADAWIGILLASATLPTSRGCEVLRPLWSEEAKHRAHSFRRLASARNRLGQPAKEDPVAAGVVAFAAGDLAERFRELRRGGERALVPCAPILRDVVTDLSALFGCPANIAFRTPIDRMSLPAYKRRALVLAACELICNALSHGFPGCLPGMIEVGLTRRGSRSACLRVADNGVGFIDGAPDLHRGVAAGLAGLLESDLRYDRTDGWTVAEIAFPVHEPWHHHEFANVE